MCGKDPQEVLNTAERDVGRTVGRRSRTIISWYTDLTLDGLQEGVVLWSQGCTLRDVTGVSP